MSRSEWLASSGTRVRILLRSRLSGGSSKVCGGEVLAKRWIIALSRVKKPLVMDFLVNMAGCVTMINGRQIQAARALLGWTQQDLADKAVVSVNAVARIERALVDARMSTVESMLRAFAKAGIRFINEDGYEGVQLRKRKSG
jgi:DNA-binding XRE family transcriptional regulator